MVLFHGSDNSRNPCHTLAFRGYCKVLFLSHSNPPPPPTPPAWIYTVGPSTCKSKNISSYRPRPAPLRPFTSKPKIISGYKIPLPLDISPPIAFLVLNLFYFAVLKLNCQ